MAYSVLYALEISSSALKASSVSMMEIGNLIAARNTAVDARSDENKLDDGLDAPAAESPTAASMPTSSTASTGPGLQRPRGMRRLEGPNSRVGVAT